MVVKCGRFGLQTDVDNDDDDEPFFVSWLGLSDRTCRVLDKMLCSVDYQPSYVAC